MDTELVTHADVVVFLAMLRRLTHNVIYSLPPRLRIQLNTVIFQRTQCSTVE